MGERLHNDLASLNKNNDGFEGKTNGAFLSCLNTTALNRMFPSSKNRFLFLPPLRVLSTV